MIPAQLRHCAAPQPKTFVAGSPAHLSEGKSFIVRSRCAHSVGTVGRPLIVDGELVVHASAPLRMGFE